MIFRQFFDNISSTYTYLISSGKGREALIIDPVLEKTDQYILLLNQLELRLVKVIDTHIHADHISGLPELRSSSLGNKYLSKTTSVKSFLPKKELLSSSFMAYSHCYPRS